MQPKKAKNDHLKYYNIEKFWDLANNDSLADEIRERSFSALVRILSLTNCRIEDKVYYLSL